MNIIRYEVTGVLYRSNTRFKKVFTNLRWALCINLWRGTVWAVHEDGKRKKIRTVWN